MSIETDNERHPAVLQVEYPERCSGLLALLGALFSIWAVLMTGRYPRGLFNFGVSAHKWGFRIDA